MPPRLPYNDTFPKRGAFARAPGRVLEAYVDAAATSAMLARRGMRSDEPTLYESPAYSFKLLAVDALENAFDLCFVAPPIEDVEFPWALDESMTFFHYDSREPFAECTLLDVHVRSARGSTGRVRVRVDVLYTSSAGTRTELRQRFNVSVPGDMHVRLL